MKRTLTLHSEALTELTIDELGGVAAAAQADSGLSCPVTDCVGNPPTFPPRCYSTPWC